MVTADLAAPDPSVLESDVQGADAVLSGLGRVEVFGPDSAINRHFTTGPVAGFLVDDSGNGWVQYAPSCEASAAQARAWRLDARRPPDDHGRAT